MPARQVLYHCATPSALSLFFYMHPFPDVPVCSAVCIAVSAQLPLLFAQVISYPNLCIEVATAVPTMALVLDIPNAATLNTIPHVVMTPQP